MRLQVEAGDGAAVGRLEVQDPVAEAADRAVMYGVMVARSSVSTGWPSAARALAAWVMSSAVE